MAIGTLNLGNGPEAEARKAALPQSALPGGQPTDGGATPIVPTTIEMLSLASYIRKVFHDNAMHREISGVDKMLMDALRASKAEYSEETKAKLRRAGVQDDLFTPLTIVKQRAAHSQLTDMFTNPGDKSWVLSASPMPEVPESVARDEYRRIIADFMQLANAQIQMAEAQGREPDPSMLPTPEQAFRYAEVRMDEVHRKQVEWAKIRAARMEKTVHDKMVEGGWTEAFKQFCGFLTVYGTAAIVGPVPRIKMRKAVRETKLGTVTYVLEPREVLCYEAINPWDLYPSSGARKADEGYLCIRRRFTTESLWRFASKRAKDSTDSGEWLAGTIEALLQRYPEGGLRIDDQPYDIVRSILEKDGPDNTNRCMLEGIEFFGNVRGSMLRQLNIFTTNDGRMIEDSEFYEVDAIEMGGYVIYCKVIDERIGRPVSKGVFYEDPGSWWGGNIAQRLDSTQRMMNSALRNLSNNMAMASGPMVYVKDASRLVDKSSDALKIQPWKVIAFEQSAYGQNDVPVGTIKFDSNISELLAVFDWAKKQSDDDSGIPAYTYGSNAGAGGAMRTSTGLQTMLSEANRVMKDVEIGLDTDVVRDTVRRTVDYLMVYGRDLSIKGDCEVNPAGVIGLILRQQESDRRKQMLQIVLTPLAQQIVGPRPAAELLRKEFADLGFDNVDEVMPSKEKMELQETLSQLERFNAAMAGYAAQQQGQPQLGGGDGGAAPQIDAPRPQMDAPNALAPAAPQPTSALQLNLGNSRVAERRAAA